VGAVLALGAILIFGVIVGLILTIIGIFVGNIIFFDSIILAVISGIISNQIWKVHPALCLVIALVLFVFLYWLQKTKVGFWIIGILLSAFWALVFGFLAYAFSSSDLIWGYVVMGLGFILMIALHLKARNR